MDKLVTQSENMDENVVLQKYEMYESESTSRGVAVCSNFETACQKEMINGCFLQIEYRRFYKIFSTDFYGFLLTSTAYY